MCYSCFQSYGSEPFEGAEKIAALVSDIDAYGELHVIVDDWNLETEYFEEALKSKLTEIERAFCNAMLPLSEGQRSYVMGLAEGEGR